MVIGVCSASMRQFSLPPLAPNQLLSSVVFAFLNFREGAWRLKLASSAGAQKLEAISGSTVFRGGC